MPLRSATGKALLVAALAGVAWGGVQTLHSLKARAEVITVTAERDRATAVASTLTATVNTLTHERDAAREAARRAAAQRTQARQQLREARNALEQALRDSPDWADDPVPSGVRDALRPRTP